MQIRVMQIKVMQIRSFLIRGWVSGNSGGGGLHDTDDILAENLSIDSHASVGGAGSRGHFIFAGPVNTKTLR